MIIIHVQRQREIAPLYCQGYSPGIFCPSGTKPHAEKTLTVTYRLGWEDP